MASDLRTLKTAARKKTRAASVTRRLKRTEGATRQKVFSLELSFDPRARILTTALAANFKP